MTMRRSRAMPRPRCGASTIGSWRRSNPDSTARPPGARCAREIGGHQRQRARQDVGQNQIMAPPAQPAAAISGSAADPHQAGDAVARDIVAGDRDRARIDVARPTPGGAAAWPRRSTGCRCRRRYRADGAIRRRRASACERQQAAAGRGMLAGAERGRRIEHDRRSPRPAPRRDDASHRQKTGRSAAAGKRAGFQRASRGRAVSLRRSRPVRRRQPRRRAPAAPTAPGSAPRDCG